MSQRMIKTIFAGLLGGLVMWFVAGLWHNLVLPAVNKKVEAHHEGLVIMFIAYILLSFFITYFYLWHSKAENYIFNGLKIGSIIGILWVFPHGLAMAGAHNTSILYEIKNALWHIFEQGIGGIAIALILKKLDLK